MKLILLIDIIPKNEGNVAIILFSDAFFKNCNRNFKFEFEFFKI